MTLLMAGGGARPFGSLKQGERMKLHFRTRSMIAIAATTAVAISGIIVAPAHAARSTVIVVESNTFTSLNIGNPDDNIVINGDVTYLTSMGLWYFNDKGNIVANPKLGSYKITKNSAKDFQVTYTIAPGRLWSDGTPITGADLLLSHVTRSTAYNKKAGLPDPSNADNTPAFNSGSYGSVYDLHIVGMPKLSADGMSVTIAFDSQIPDWVVNGYGGVFPVHTLELLAAKKTALGTAAENLAAKAKFVSDFNSYDTASMKAMGAIWTTGYETTKIDKTTNPLLLVNNGAYLVDSVNDSQIKMVENPKYNSGPETNGITTVVIKQGIADGSPSAQALANKDIDVYQGQPTADTVAQLKAISSATVIGSSSQAYEHIELRVASSDSKPYTGPFAMSSGQKGADLRKAFLLAYPREAIVNKLIKPINPDAVVLGSVWTLADGAGYDNVAASNGSSFYSAGTQADRTAAALKLVQKWYPKASATNSPVKVNLLWGSPGNTRRENEAALLIANEKAAGFAVTAPATKGWGGKLTSSDYDAHFFIFDQTAKMQDGQNCGTFQTGLGSNYTGYSNKSVDADCIKLAAKSLAASVVGPIQLHAERQIIKDAFFMGIFQAPEVTAYTSDLKGISPAPYSPALFWNFWTWHF